jgi:hypothetical protein
MVGTFSVCSPAVITHAQLLGILFTRSVSYPKDALTPPTIPSSARSDMLCHSTNAELNSSKIFGSSRKKYLKNLLTHLLHLQMFPTLVLCQTRRLPTCHRAKQRTKRTRYRIRFPMRNVTYISCRNPRSKKSAFLVVIVVSFCTPTSEFPLSV